MGSRNYCWRWRSAAHFGQKRTKCSAVSFEISQWGQIAAVMWPLIAWCKTVELDLFTGFIYVAGLWEKGK